MQRERHFARKEKVYGQFFTPPEVAGFIVDFCMASLSGKPELAVDPACGDGAFLKALIGRGVRNPVGVDIDDAVLMRIPEDVRGASKILRGDGLLWSELDGKADMVVGNPPFSSKYGRVSDGGILSMFELGRGRRSQAVEILFLEKFIRLARESGVIGIILPSGVFTNLPLDYVREFIFRNTEVLGVVSLPRGIFRGTESTASKTNILFARKRSGNGAAPAAVFMAIVRDLGDLRRVLEAYTEGKECEEPPAFWADPSVALYPEYHILSKHIPGEGERLGNLVSEIFCGRTEYGPKRSFAKRGVRFISAKVVTPLGLDFERDERKFVDPRSEMYKERAHVREGDLLFVRVGEGCIGRAAVVTGPEERGVADDWIYVIRPKNRELSYYLAFYLQSGRGASQINLLKRGVGTVTIPKRLLKDIIVVLPPEPELKKFKKLYLEMVRQRKKDRRRAEQIFKKAIEMIDARSAPL